MTKDIETQLPNFDWCGAKGAKWAQHLDGLERMLAPVNDALIARLSLETATRIADLGCGGGGSTQALYVRAREDASVDGFDLSPELLALARRRCAGASFHQADLQIDGPPAAPYERLASRFGVMFFNEPRAAFSNLLRWLKPGGCFAFAVWGAPVDNPWASIPRRVVESLVKVASVSPGSPGPFRYGDVNRMLDELAKAGFAEPSATTWTGTIPLGTATNADDAARFALAAFSTLAEAMERCSADDVANVQKGLAAELRGFERDALVQLPASVHLVTGLHPK
ncbi:MAG: class I SAM-dependent methyltransferase [Myxococcota bacterium]